MCFSYLGASPALMGKCCDDGKNLVFMKPNGAFLARVSGREHGNVLLRRAQYRAADDKAMSLRVAKNMISAKLYSSASVLRRAVSDYEMRLDSGKVSEVAKYLKENSARIFKSTDADSVRGLEGESAGVYFSVFDQLVLQQKEDFTFVRRSRRPPLDPVNALLSFGYSLTASMCASALEAAGLDPYVGFFHTDRSGRMSLALDLSEEFRAALVDRFVLTLINRRMVSKKSFCVKEDGAVTLTDQARKDFIKAWQSKKQEQLIHPYLEEKMEWGIVPVVQAMLLARYIRGDIDDYPPFVWK